MQSAFDELYYRQELGEKIKSGKIIEGEAQAEYHGHSNLKPKN